MRLVAKKKQKIAKELKHPDQFVDFWTHTWNRIVAVVGPRRRPAVALLVAAGVVLVGAIVMHQLDQAKRVAATEALSRIQKMAVAPLRAEDDKDAKLRPPADDEDDTPRFKTADERQAAVLKEIDAFLDGKSSRRLKAEGLVVKAGELLDAGRSDDAIKAFEAALASKLEPRLRFLAHEGIGYAHEAKGELDEALASFALLSADANDFGGFYADRALYHKARLTQEKGDAAGAAKLYKQVLDKDPESPLHDQISDRLAVLEAK